METILRIVQSPFLLPGTDRVHLEQYLSLHLNQGVQVQDIAQNIYVDDINIGEAAPKQVTQQEVTASKKQDLN